MKYPIDVPLVRTIGERCRVCYTCVRECPAKAIRVSNGQAEVIPERCIGCGNCVRVCSQKAKDVMSCVPAALQVLHCGKPAAAIVAPSFPAEFTEIDWRRMVGMLRKLGFAYVCEVGFGADLVAERYSELLSDPELGRRIATTCPAIVAYVERHHPVLVDALAPIVSPMVAMARVIHQAYGPKTKVVFIGPCIAKKGEIRTELLPFREINCAITFVELRQLFETQGVKAEDVEPSDFDPPHAGLGALFSVSRGLLQAADIDENLMDGKVAVADGRVDFVEALKEFEAGDLDSRLLEVLACQGCIMGPGMTSQSPLFSRRRRIAEYVREALCQRHPAAHEQDMRTYAALDLTRRFSQDDQRAVEAVPPERIREILVRMGKEKPEDELNCGACGYESCSEHASAIASGLAEQEMCLPYTIEELNRSISELHESNKQLASAQEALLHSEKLASMGQLAAGIAHEVNNPLGVVLMYAHILLEEAEKHPDMREDLKMIAEQADRCKKIVAGLLHFARQNKVLRQKADVRELVARALRATRPPASVVVVEEHQAKDPTAELDVDQMVQVLTNLITNAYDAMPGGGTLTIRTQDDGPHVIFALHDTGVGIAQDNMRKLFQPFFTTKQIGKGTGLGLPVSYGIVKMHRGSIRVESNADPSRAPTGTTFTVTVPRRGLEE